MVIPTQHSLQQAGCRQMIPGVQRAGYTPTRLPQGPTNPMQPAIKTGIHFGANPNQQAGTETEESCLSGIVNWLKETGAWLLDKFLRLIRIRKGEDAPPERPDKASRSTDEIPPGFRRKRTASSATGATGPTPSNKAAGANASSGPTAAHSGSNSAPAKIDPTQWWEDVQKMQNVLKKMKHLQWTPEVLQNIARWSNLVHQLVPEKPDTLDAIIKLHDLYPTQPPEKLEEIEKILKSTDQESQLGNLSHQLCPEDPETAEDLIEIVRDIHQIVGAKNNEGVQNLLQRLKDLRGDNNPQKLVNLLLELGKKQAIPQTNPDQMKQLSDFFLQITELALIPLAVKNKLVAQYFGELGINVFPGILSSAEPASAPEQNPSTPQPDRGE